MFKDQQIELMALIALVFMTKSMMVTSNSPPVEPIENSPKTAAQEVGLRSAIIEVDGTQYRYQGKTFAKEQLNELINTLKSDGVRAVGLHSNDPLLMQISDLNNAVFEIGGELSI